jgi:hypothetical protein
LCVQCVFLVLLWVFHILKLIKEECAWHLGFVYLSCVFFTIFWYDILLNWYWSLVCKFGNMLVSKLVLFLLFEDTICWFLVLQVMWMLFVKIKCQMCLKCIMILDLSMFLLFSLVVIKPLESCHDMRTISHVLGLMLW